MATGPIIRRPMRPAAKGEPPTLEWARWVENTLRRIIDSPTPRQRPITGGGSAEKPPFWTEIAAVPDSDPVEYQVTVTPGYLTYQNAGASESELGVTGYISPKIDDGDGNLVSMEDAEVPPVPLPAVVSYVYLRVKTDADGVPKFEDDAVTIEAFDEPKDSIHHVRPSPSGGEEEGDYYFLILETESNGGTPAAPIVKRRITGNRESPNQLVEIANIGGKRELYKGYTPGPDDKHELRTLEQLEGEGVPIIKPLDGGDPGADPPVPAEEEGDTIKFRLINKGERDQIDVRLQGDDVIVVEGNGYLNNQSGFVTDLSVDDGLVVGFGAIAFGITGEVRITDGCGTILHILSFTNGLLTGYATEAITP